ncbi:outer membrane beta-barrel protein [Granulicella sibirica]|uniref:Outer membrane protein beta-barrel domain-containing protein n=1 Tax=Granulicella sibirica TaxID=2479048 RepID=A0A4Q0T0M9_9BACT|nr:outer membrane beta-barrel protein [Granulicella sibirica]RXH55051.1 hypothetical protein GRAN_4155 [Granulicella sibirica]
MTLLCVLGGASISLHAQASPTASRLGDLQVGAGFVSADSDYADNRYKGVFGYVDFDVTNHLGAEFEIHQIYSPYSDDVRERTYEIGGRYYRHYGRFTPYGKLMYGRGVFNFQQNLANLAYNMFAGGVGVDYRVMRHVNARAEFEYQHWMSFQGSSLSPSLISIGAAYHF